MASGHLDERCAEMRERMKRENGQKRAMNLVRTYDRARGLAPEVKSHSHDHSPVIVNNDAKLLHRKSITWNREQYKRACGPMVYIYWSHTGNGKKALYVGKSRHGLRRALDVDHHAKPARDIATEFEFILCASELDATEMEKRLIRELKPSYNIVTY